MTAVRSVTLALLILLSATAHVSATLVAYYAFDDGTTSSTFEGLSGYCPNVVPDTGTLKVFQGADTSKLSVSVWIRTPGSFAQSSIVYKAGLVSLSVYGDTGQTVTIKSDNTISTNTAYNTACVYDGTTACMYINGAKQSSCSSSVKSVFTEGTGTLMVGSDGTNKWQGTIDEVKIYDHALAASDITLINQASAANDKPVVQIAVNESIVSSYSSQVLQNTSISAIVADSKKAFSGAAQNAASPTLFYQWEVLSTVCGGIIIGSANSSTTILDFEAVGTSTVKVCASDGEIAQQATLTTIATASTPVLELQPKQPIISIPEGAVEYPITVQGSSVPSPSYQWQRLVTKEENVTTNATLAKRLDGEWEILFEREIVLVEEFEAIPDGTSGTLLLNGTLDLNDTLIRCLVYNGGGSVATDNFTVVINTNPSPSPLPSGSGGGSSSSSTDTGLIAGVAGGVGGGLLLLCLLLVVVALVWGARRGRSPYRKLVQPDYDALAYGDVTEDVVLPKKQLEDYRALEQLVAAPDHRLALAICEVSTLNEKDKVYRSLLRVLAGQYQAYNFIARTISLEVASADEEGTLFRANSASAKLFTQYMRMIALKYLWHVLVLSVHALNDNAREASDPGISASSGSLIGSRMFGKSYRMEADEEEGASVALDVLGVSTMELDPQKLDEASDLTINTLELWLTAQKMLKLVTQNERMLPQELRMLIRRIHDEVAMKFSEEAVFRAMGGFFFLRLICPALLAPQVHGLLEQPPHPMAQRQLILVTKVLQNLANDTLPGAKEAYMEKLNAFIVSNKPALAQFYDQIVGHPEHGRLTDPTVPQRVRNDALIQLRTFLEANLKAVEANLSEVEDGEEVISELRRILHAGE